MSGEPGSRLYRTGDIVRRLADGAVEFLGRVDHQIKLRGFRIELAEIEAAISRHSGVHECAVLVRESADDKYLVAYLVPSSQPAVTMPAQRELVSELRAALKVTLPPYMVPAHFAILEALPLTSSGKVDRAALGRRDEFVVASNESGAAPRSSIEEMLCAIWCQVLGRDRVSIDANFFDLGGHSLLLARVRELIRERLQVDLPMVDLFMHPTIRQLSRGLSTHKDADAPLVCDPAGAQPTLASSPAVDSLIAVIGMAGRFPGAHSTDELWTRLCAGDECISFFSAEEALAAGAQPEQVANPRYVCAAGVLNDIEYFDAEFFGYSPREAALIDPQQRIFLECAHAALEQAAYSPKEFPGRIAVFAGASPSTYFLNNLAGNRELALELGEHPLSIGNTCDFLATRVSYKLDLKGPSMAVQTACSTSLVAIHMACRSLISGECEIALAGGVSIAVPERLGYLYQGGGIMSPDGHCRAFDAAAAGTINGSGAGVVVLKRLRDAKADGDTILAVIRGTAINNDGSVKAGYSAPSVAGQAAVIRDALTNAGVAADSVSYVEAHGTGTPLGDPIEIAALTRAYRASTAKRQYCAIGSLKTNLGHLDTAAGVAGLIKVVQALRHRILPASLNFERPNPKLSLDDSPFFVNKQTQSWENAGAPRRAGVSSFGIGGTNAHVILEEAPPQAEISPSHPWNLIVLSAKTRTALDATRANLVARLRAAVESGEQLDLSDVAFTLQVGRQAFDHRLALVCSDLTDALGALEPLDERRVLSRVQEPCTREVIFMFPGQGAQHIDMGRGLYQREPVFRDAIDRCAEVVARRRGLDLHALLYPAHEDPATARQLEQTINAQPALFAVEYALAQLYMHWGIKPQAMLCHSIGEYVAACIAGVFTLDDALELVAARGELLQRLPAGAMLAVDLSAERVGELLGSTLTVSIVGTASTCVISGPVEDVETLALRLESMRIGCRRVSTMHAAHSPMVEPILGEFEQLVSRMVLSPPSLPFTSSTTGTWIRSQEATSPAYWVRQMRLPVLFAAGVGCCLEKPGAVLLELGPGHTLSNWARKHPARNNRHVILPALRHPEDAQDDGAFALHTIARLWLCGVTPAWQRLYTGEQRRRIVLPTYPFERKRYWIDASKPAAGPRSETTQLDMRTEERLIARIEQRLAVDLQAEPTPEGLDSGLNALCSNRAYALLQSRGHLGAGRRRLSEISANLGVLPRFEKLFAFMVRSLVEDGIATADAETIELTAKAVTLKTPDALVAELGQALPEFGGVIASLDRCLMTYGDVLNGASSNVAVMHEKGAGAITTSMEERLARYWDSPRYLRLLQEVIYRLLRAARGRPLRVLEIGGGFGRLTWQLVPYLDGMGVEYWFTDVGRSFVLDAEKRAQAEGWDFMRFAVFDICAAPIANGLAPESFDIVLAYNVLHVAQDLSTTVGHLERLLVPGGVMLAIEVTRLARWHEAMVALEEGYWRFSDALRPLSPILAHEEWERFLGSRGFYSVQVHPQARDRRARTDHALLIAQKQGSAIQPWRPTDPTPPTQPGPGYGLHERPDLATVYAPPRNPLEQKLAELWQAMLGIERIGIHDDFFMLGGDSLIAIQLLARTREHFAVSLSQHVLLRTRTIALLADVIQESWADAESPRGPAEPRRSNAVEALQLGGSGVPLFLVPPVGGHLYCYRALARAVGAGHPIYGFVAPGVDGDSEPLKDMRELAAYYIRALRAQQPEGPYALAAWSFGGVVAYEMAQQLKASGVSVAMVALIDSVARGGSQWLEPLDEVSLLASFAVDAGLLPRNALADTVSRLMDIPAAQRLRFVAERAAQFGLLPAEVTSERLLHLFRLFRSNLQALSEYAPAPYSGPIVLFRSSESTSIPVLEALIRSARDLQTLGWGELCGDHLEVHRISGNHYTMMEPPGVDEMGRHLRRSLEKLSRSPGETLPEAAQLSDNIRF